MSTAMPRPGRWISPGHAGLVGSPATKQLHRSVPPEMDATCTPSGNDSTAHAFVSGDSGEPVEQIVRSAGSDACSFGTNPAFRTESRYFADTPRSVSPWAWARSVSASGPGWNGDPSYSTAVAPEAGTDASQFHIIQPAVV